MRDVDIILPWKEGCIYRELNLTWIKATWEDLDYNVVIGELDIREPWCKAKAVAAALKKSTAEVLVISDADVWCPKWEEAIDRVVIGECTHVLPHSEVHRLDPEATSRVLLGNQGFEGKLMQPPYKAVLGGGAVIITRETYERCPLDPRFVGWGGEDEAWGVALRSSIGFGGVTRDSPMYHLWHPTQDKNNKENNPRPLRDRYIHAAHKPETMAALIAEVVSAP